MSRCITGQIAANVAVIGGGVAGATIALRLSELGVNTTLFEKSSSLVNGPPICHLHAGGNLYREISDEQCLVLLEQSIDTLKVYRQGVNWRPTLIAIPVGDRGVPSDLIPRLDMLKCRYAELVAANSQNKVLAEPDDYYRPYSLEQLQALAQLPLPKTPVTLDDWLIPVAKQLDLSKLKFPVFLVQEYGLSAFRFAAIAHLAMESLPSCHLKLNHKVVNIKPQSSALAPAWEVSYCHEKGPVQRESFDFIVNACGFRSGEIDDMLGYRRERLVEFKAAYVAKWAGAKGQWPEVIIHGKRGTPAGMAQLTPYPDNYFQLHGMTDVITLFKDGLVASSLDSAQPRLASHHLQKIDEFWPVEDVNVRTQAAIQHVGQFIPAFNTAVVGAKPLFGAQQIPGQDASLRAADVSFVGGNYARAEIVKASSALAAADAILQRLVESGHVERALGEKIVAEHYFPITQRSSNDAVSMLAAAIAESREYPQALALQIQASINSGSNSEKVSATCSGL